MPQTQTKTPDTVEAPLQIIHADALRLQSVEDSIAHTETQIRQQIVIGNNVSALRERRDKLVRERADLLEEIELYPFARREAEQAEILKRFDAGFALRQQNWAKAAEAKERQKELLEQAEQAGREIIRWQNSPDGLHTADQDLRRHQARFGNLVSREA
jgi:hypothetical protein